MEPTYHDLQLLIVDKNTKSFSRDQVVLIKKENIDNSIIKRIIAVENDTVVIKDKKLYINNIKQDNYVLIDYSGLLENEIVLQKDEYIVLGDNISESKDSRYKEIGIIKKSEIVGKVLNGK